MSALTVRDGSTKKKLKGVKYFVSKEPLLQRKPTCLFASHESLHVYSHPMKGTRVPYWMEFSSIQSATQLLQLVPRAKLGAFSSRAVVFVEKFTDSAVVSKVA